MAKTMYEKASKVLKEIKEKNGETVRFSILKEEIIKNIGGHKNRTIKPYIELMIDLKMIESTNGGLDVIIH